MQDKLRDHQLVTVDKHLVLIGGDECYDDANKVCYNNDLLRLTCTNHACMWHPTWKGLKIPRSNFVAMVIPDELAECS